MFDKHNVECITGPTKVQRKLLINAGQLACSGDDNMSLDGCCSEENKKQNMWKKIHKIIIFTHIC